MSVIELHPDELLERECDQTLSPEDQSRLDAHLERCPACRLCRQAKDDFAAERDASPLSERRLGRLAPAVLTALTAQARDADDDGKAEAALAGRGGSSAPWAWLPLGLRARRMALVAAVVLTGATAAAASGWSNQLWGGAFSQWEAPPAPTSTWAAIAEQAAANAQVAAGPTPEPAPPERDEPQSLPEPPDEPKTAVRQPSEARIGPAMALFDQAATARARGDYDQALKLYRELQQRFPSSAESRTSRAIVARLLLDTGDAEAALADYGEYLADGGAPLTEEAMVGRARAYQRLGRADEERHAWEALLRRFPGSMHGAHARARLQALAGDPQE